MFSFQILGLISTGNVGKRRNEGSFFSVSVSGIDGLDIALGESWSDIVTDWA